MNLRILNYVLGGLLVVVALAGWTLPARSAVSAPNDACSTGNGSPQQVIDACTALLNSGEPTPQRRLALYIERSQAEEKLGKYLAATQDLGQAIALAPRAPSLYVARAIDYTRVTDFQLAIADCTHALELQPYDVQALYIRGGAYDLSGDYQDAIGDYTLLLTVRPQDANPFLLRAHAYERLTNFEKALADYNSALQLAPDNADAVYFRGTTYEYLDRFQEAIDDFSRVISMSPTREDAYDARGHCEFFLGHFGDAAQDFARAVALDSSDAYAVIWEHLALLHEGKPDTTFAHNAGVWVGNAWPAPVTALFLQQATPQDVLTAASTPLAGSTESGRQCEAAFYVGEWYVLAGKADNARPYLEQARQICPHDFTEYLGAVFELSQQESQH